MQEMWGEEMEVVASCNILQWTTRYQHPPWPSPDNDQRSIFRVHGYSTFSLDQSGVLWTSDFNRYVEWGKSVLSPIDLERIDRFSLKGSALKRNAYERLTGMGSKSKQYSSRATTIHTFDSPTL